MVQIGGVIKVEVILGIVCVGILLANIGFCLFDNV